MTPKSEIQLIQEHEAPMCVFGSFLAGWRACEMRIASRYGPTHEEPEPSGPPPVCRCHFSAVRGSTDYIAPRDDDIGVSMTNDAENVIAWLAYHCQLSHFKRVFYRDTTGRWDEMKHKGGKFVGFAPLTTVDILAYDLPIG